MSRSEQGRKQRLITQAAGHETYDTRRACTTKWKGGKQKPSKAKGDCHYIYYCCGDSTSSTSGGLATRRGGHGAQVMLSSWPGVWSLHTASAFMTLCWLNDGERPKSKWGGKCDAPLRSVGRHFSSPSRDHNSDSGIAHPRSIFFDMWHHPILYQFPI